MVLLRCNALNKEQLNRFSDGIKFEIDEIFIGEPILLDIINWIRENLPKYLKNSEKNSDPGAVKSRGDSNSEKNLDPDEKNLARFWIFSHHLFSKFKRRDLLTLAQRWDLNGFSLPGKPGIICVEGFESACKKFWDEIRSWSWKKIALKHSEIFPIEKEKGSLKDKGSPKIEKGSQKIFNKFPAFAEQSFNVRAGPGSGFHMDMGVFKQYLIDHDCGHAFAILFGFEKSE